ncbi:hypothetical protein [Kitasatospora sp. NPDC056800]|uniref:hypothetical protein n=1 Tax=Kitasatospora sp. NPDC056800 TaxID=3345948 RepID=UPI00367EEFE6
MLTITKSSELQRLRARSAEADDLAAQLAETAVLLAAAAGIQQKLAEENSLLRQDLGLKPAQDLHDSVEDRVAELTARNTALRQRNLRTSGTALRRFDQDAEAIRQLRLELAQVRGRAAAAAPAAEPECTVLRFRTAGGGLAVVTAEPGTYGADPYDYTLAEGRRHAWQCLACGADSDGHTIRDRDDMRRRANEHAADCRAIPAATGDTTTTKEASR